MGLAAALALGLDTVVIPTNDDGTPDYTMQIALDGRIFALRFLWNQREDRWYMDLLTDASVPLAMGIKIVTNRPLLRYLQWDPRIPQGELIAYDLVASQSGKDSDPPGLYDMAQGNRVELTYFPLEAS